MAKWQKARTIGSIDAESHLRNRELWVIAERPEERIGTDRRIKLSVSCAAYRTNVETRKGVCALVPAEFIELLPEFADDVAIISEQEWLNG